MNRIDLNSRRQEIIALAEQLFNEITSLPPEIRPDEKPRTGIAVLVIDPNDQNNMLYFTIGEPSERARYLAVKKAVSSFIYSDVSSKNKENPLYLDFPGSLTFIDEGVGDFDIWTCQASVSGLKGEEDVAISTMILADIFQLTPRDVLINIKKNFGQLPKEFSQEGHYLRKILKLESRRAQLE